MCGRITQRRSPDEYVRDIGWTCAQEHAVCSAAPRYNTAPGMSVLLLHRLHDGICHVDRMNWGYRPHWATSKKMPPAINARIEKAVTGRFFAPLWHTGRVIVPADGWYEWTGKPGAKQAWYIRLESDGPMYLAAIAGFRPDRKPDRGDGFAIVTESADAGMVDVHDRRPVVFSAENALLWMDAGLNAQRAEQLAQSRSRPTQDFIWYPVSTRVNRSGNDGPDLIKPVKLPSGPGSDISSSLF